MNTRLWITGMRPKTLPASVAPVCVGTAAALVVRARLQEQCNSGCSATPPDPDLVQATPGRIAVVFVLLVLLALSMQIAANFSNDYSDGIRGTDENRGAAEAVSGKPQRLVAAGVDPRKVLRATLIAAGITCAMGLAVMAITGHWWMILVGICCLAAGWFYVGGKHPYGYHGLGELSVFIFFGLVATLGTEYFIIGSVDLTGILAACVCGLNSVGLLMVNNYRDIDSDREAGKHTYAVLVGKKMARISLYLVYAISILISLVQFATISWTFGTVSVPAVIIVIPIAAFLLLICMKFAKGHQSKASVLAGKGTLVSALCWTVGLLLELV